ncbi:flagellar biosynthesis protein FlhF [Desulforhabdus amnigena]|jgi:flagellar biosynthesis protein FlhF|uniref:Flagellar biosynthesis protein FlhF n=1 Tax=Desulforhabdus amnigena TaxID=40218 RepID=A0A9W6D0E8_9BACT|nr:hypothetical protein [Desulforhabdus amnigena]NLJ26591.1 hypothetical protein [Deltaproteobacteria bacterium]GLI33570.1 flagellar biosynthesis regulator FlhF [Desulforhabdus amnigena]
MQIRTFKASTVNEALAQVRKELGEDALILGNRKVTVSPMETYVEVTAAAEPDRGEPLIAKPAPVDGLDLHSRNDIEEIKSFLSMLISSKDYYSKLQMQQPLAEVYHSLIVRGLDEKHCYVLLNDVLSAMKMECLDKRRVMEGFCRKLLEKINFSRPFHDLPPNIGAPHTFTFVGPTGVGKTTSLAKLAAFLKIKRNLEVGIISVDTYRIGAVNQLGTYADILNIPFLVVQTNAELRNARMQFGHHDVVLVDTSGKNFINPDHIKDLQAVFGNMDDIRHFLVLSATVKDSDLKQTIIHFHPMNIHSFIFTKIDETLSIGSIINQLLRFPYPVSYLGTGQQVPEDIELATPKRLLTFLFPAKKGRNGKE